MMTGESWSEHKEFEGHASAVVIVTDVRGTACTRYEVQLECLALGSYSGPFSLAVYIWDEREASWCRDFYYSTFKIGSCWRISGRIEYDDNGLVFVDPIYMPFNGNACELLLQHANLNVEV